MTIEPEKLSDSTREMLLRAYAAETCNACHDDVKLLSKSEHTEFDPVTDDVASRGLDLKLQDAGRRRCAVNPFRPRY